MKTLVLKSIKANTIANITLFVVCLGLLGSNVYQAHHYKQLMEQQAQVFQDAMDAQTDNYLELVKAEYPMKKTYPKRNVGSFTLSWYTPVELKKPADKLRTATGTTPKEGRTIAVDPKVIPYGTLVYIEGYGYFIAEDTGSAIKGNRIDIFINDYNKALQLGKKTATVWVLGKGKK